MYKVHVYLDTGNVYSYDVADETAAREHAAAIVTTGYRSVGKNTPKILNWYPPHRILKVKIEGKEDIKTDYKDNSRGT